MKKKTSRNNATEKLVQPPVPMTIWFRYNQNWGTGIRGLMRGMATLPQGAVSGRRQSWKTPGELGVSNSMKCDISLQCFDTVGWATGRASDLYKMDVRFLVVMIRLQLCTTYSSSSPVVTNHHLHHPLLQ